MSLRVELLCVGWIVRERGVVLEAHSTSSIIIGGNEVVVVDTSDGAMRKDILTSLDRLGLVPEDVSIIVSTHLHHDHVSNDDLFTKARKIVHMGEGPSPDHDIVTGDHTDIAPGIKLVHTPGHTRGAMSVFVKAEKRTAIAGDALPTRDNYIRMVPPGLNYDPDIALRSMKRILDWAETVVPGHGPAFEVVH